MRLGKNWKEKPPDVYIGILMLDGVINLVDHPEIIANQLALSDKLRGRYGGLDRASLRQDPVLAAYAAFCRKFRKTYHVQLQLESVVFHEKPILSPSTLGANRIPAQHKTGLLTTARDLEHIKQQLSADVTDGGEKFKNVSKNEKQLKKGDQ